MARPLEWPVKRVRETFFSFFGENQHVHLSSPPVIPVHNHKIPLINACLNRFKGTIGHRACFLLRCILIGDDDLGVFDHYRKDISYHRFTEILGSWSFGDNSKEEAICLLFTLLSKKFKLPLSRISATYFSGDASSRLSSDNDSKNTLQKYLAKKRIVPSMSKEDFWMSGETGPCGPCICIGFFVDDEFIEICRLVFVEFNRQADGVLDPLQAKHVFTGIKLECLAAILQRNESHYDLDVYDDLLSDIHSFGCPETRAYSGKIGADDTDGVDTAYRLLADHIRMIAVVNAPSSQLGLGNEGREYFLWCADKQAVQYGHQVLKTNQEKYELILERALLNEADLCLELGYRLDKIVEDEVMIYQRTMAELRDQELPFAMGGKKKCVTSVVWYATRVIKFLGQRTIIILKKKYTHCSLVALCNVLLLGGKIFLSLDVKKVSEGHLIYLVQRYILHGNTQMQLEQNLELSEFNKQVLGVLPKLPGSLYFDVTFASSCGFEQTSETTLFGILGVPLHHGWLVDPQNVELASSIAERSYHKLSYDLSVHESIQSSTNSGPEKHGGSEDPRGMISSFLQGSQLTSYGFSALNDDLKARHPTLLIWNEKLITVCKVEDRIYVLLNDLSLLNIDTDAVWERLTEENSDGVFVDCDFVPTDSKIESILPLTKNEKQKRKRREKMSLTGLLVPKEKEKDMGGLDAAPSSVSETSPYEASTSFMKPDLEGITPHGEGLYLDRSLTHSVPDAALLGMHGNLNIRHIDFFGRSTHVIHQIDDGPCGLIAVFNVLLLKGSVYFDPHETVVSIEYLLTLLFSLLEGSVKMKAHSPEVQRNIYDVAQTLVTGFDVDVIFTRTDGFTETPEWFLLDCLDLNLRHGWIAAPDLLRGPEVTFESLTLAANEPDFPHAETIKKFLRGPQLTPIGLDSLQEDLVEKVPCILYWNKHYNAIVKIRGQLLSLVTDSGYLRTSAVWETLHEVSGGGLFLDSNFRSIYTGLDAAPAFVPGTSDSEASTSFMKPDLEGSTPDGEGLYLDRSFKHSGPNADLLVVGAIECPFLPIVPETSASEGSTSFIKPDLEGITPHGAGLYLDRSITHSGPNTARLTDNFHGSHSVPKRSTRRLSHEKSLPSPQIGEISLEDFVRIRGNEFSELRTLFADGTSLDVASTTKIGRVFGLDLLEDIVFSHDAGFSWNGKFDLKCIFVIDGVRVEIRALYCDKFSEEAKFNDYSSFICGIMELYRIAGIGLPAFFNELARMLSNPPRVPRVCTARQLQGFQRRLHGYWECMLTTMAFRSSLATAGLFAGIHRIRRFAPKNVRRALRTVLSTRYHFKDDWRFLVFLSGHPVLIKVLRYIPGMLDGSNENAKEDEDDLRKFGRYEPDNGSLSIYVRQVTEHPKSKEDLELEKEIGEESEPMNILSDLGLLVTHYLQGRFSAILEALLCSDDMTSDLSKWLEEVLEDYTRPEVLDRGRARGFRHQ